MSAVAVREKPEKERSENLNVRIPHGQKRMLECISERLGISVNSVVTIMIRWQFVAASNQELWINAVATFRDLLGEDADDGVVLHDFSDDEWHDRLTNYRALQDIGLIENLRYKQSSSVANRWLCSFRLTQTGRVVASVLDENVCRRHDDDAHSPAPLPLNNGNADQEVAEA